MKRTKTISISSGKGGVGKTTITANLAVALAEQGFKVLILDGDLGMANIDILFGARTEANIYQVIQGEREITEVIQPLHKNIDLISGGSGLVELSRLNPFERRGLVDAVSQLDGIYDYLLIDTSPGISDNVLHLNAAADECAIVITPDAASLADSYALIKVLHQEYGLKRFSIIANEVRGESEGLALFNRFNDVVNNFLYISLDYWGSVPTDTMMRKVVQGQRLILRHSRSSEGAKSIHRLAAHIEAKSSRPEAQAGLKFFWEQVVGVA